MTSLGPRRVLPAIVVGLCLVLPTGCSGAPDARPSGPSERGASETASGGDAPAGVAPTADLPGEPRPAAGDGIDLGVVPGSAAEAKRRLTAVQREVRAEASGAYRIFRPAGDPYGDVLGLWDLRGRKAQQEAAVEGQLFTVRVTPDDLWFAQSLSANGAAPPSCWAHTSPRDEVAFTVAARPAIAILGATPVGVSRQDPAHLVARMELGDVLPMVFGNTDVGFPGLSDRDRDRPTTVVIATVDDTVSEVTIPVRDAVDVFGAKRLGPRLRKLLLPYLGEVRVTVADLGTPLTVEQPPAETVVEMGPSTTMDDLAAGCRSKLDD